MSAISKLRAEVDKLENRIMILEGLVLSLLKESGIQDHSVPMHKVDEEESFEMRTRIGY